MKSEEEDDYVMLSAPTQPDPTPTPTTQPQTAVWRHGLVIFNDKLKGQWLSQIAELDKAIEEMGDILEGKRPAVVATPVVDKTEPENVIQDDEEQITEPATTMNELLRSPPRGDEVPKPLTAEEKKERERVKKMLAEMQEEIEREELAKDHKRVEEDRQRAEKRQAMLTEKVVIPLTKNDWLQGDKCLNCGKKFSVKRWSHHCRNCAG
mgnify:CR=1 FL=1